MSLEENIDKYLGANRPDIAGLRLFNASASPEELRKRFAEGAALRQQLVRQGPSVILPMLRAAPPKMGDAAALAESPIAMLNPEGYAQIAAGMTEAIFTNAQDVILEIGKPAAEPLLGALQERDPNVRALAAAFLGLRNLASHRILPLLQNAFFKDEDVVVKLASAISLIECGYTDHKTIDLARQALGAFLDEASPRWTTLGATPVDLCKHMLPQLIGKWAQR